MKLIISVVSAVLLILAVQPIGFSQGSQRTVAPVEIVGQVRFSRGTAPAQLILVTLENFVGSLVEQVRTDRLGKFKFSGLPPAQYVVIVSAPGFAEVRQEVDTQTTRSAYVMLQLTPIQGEKSSQFIDAIIVDAKVPEIARNEYDKGRTALLKDSDAREGISHLEKAVSNYPAFLDAHLLLGTAYMDLGRWDNAERELRRTLEINPETASALFALGEVLLRNKRYKEAEQVLQSGLKLDSGSWQGRLALGRVYWASGDLAKAGPEVGRAIQIKPDLAEAHLLGGNILLRARQADQALAMFEEYLRLEPKGQFAAETRQVVEKIKKSLGEGK